MFAARRSTRKDFYSAFVKKQQGALIPEEQGRRLSFVTELTLTLGASAVAALAITGAGALLFGWMQARRKT